MHEPGSKTTTSTTGCRAGATSSASKSPYHGSNSSLYYHPYHTRTPGHVPPAAQQQPPRHRVLAGGAILQPSSNNQEDMQTMLPAGVPPQQGACPPPAGPLPQHHPHPAVPHQVQQQQQCKKNLQKMMGISPSDIDKYSRIFFPVTFTCFNLMYWIIYLHVSDEVADDLMLLHGG